MSYSAQLVPEPSGVSPYTVIDTGVSPDGTPHGRAYAVPLDGWQRQAAHDPQNLSDSVSSYYHNDAAWHTGTPWHPEIVDQGPYMLQTQGWVPPVDTERPDGRTDPAAAGQARPDLWMESTHYRRGSGSDSTTFMSAPGVTRTPYGWQDGSSWTQFQDEQLGLAQYGSRALTPISNDPSVPATMPDTMKALPPQPAGGWTSVPVNTIGQEVLIGYAANAKVSQQATSQEFTANSANIGVPMTRIRHVGQGTPSGNVGGTPGSNWYKGA